MPIDGVIKIHTYIVKICNVCIMKCKTPFGALQEWTVEYPSVSLDLSMT